MEIYKTEKWRKLRSKALRRDSYKSVLSARYGRSVQADTVHHILPVEIFPEYMWRLWNLASMTSGEHDRMHVRRSHQLTAEGMELARRTALKQGLDVQEVMRRLESEEDNGGEKKSEGA